MTYASIWKFGGAVQRIASDATAFGDRSIPIVLSLDAIWSNAADDNANIGWVRDCRQGMQRFSTGHMYLNFAGLGEGENLVRDAFGSKIYGQLQKVKRKYDPNNICNMNQNILSR